MPGGIRRSRHCQDSACGSVCPGACAKWNIKPQENGSHCGCSYLEVRDCLGGLRVHGDDFSFNVSPYTQEELTVKKHNFELEKSDSVILCVDAFQTGIGSNSCGPMLRDEYASPSDIAMHVTFSPFGVSE